MLQGQEKYICNKHDIFGTASVQKRAKITPARETAQAQRAVKFVKV